MGELLQFHRIDRLDIFRFALYKKVKQISVQQYCVSPCVYAGRRGWLCVDRHDQADKGVCTFVRKYTLRFAKLLTFATLSTTRGTSKKLVKSYHIVFMRVYRCHLRQCTNPKLLKPTRSYPSSCKTF